MALDLSRLDLAALQTGDAALLDSICSAIRTRGPVTFAWFMEQALYHPQHGYYSSGRARLGRGGDYFTSVSVGPLFGQLLALQFAQVWETLGRPRAFTIVEQGAHGGEFASDLLGAAQAEGGAFFDAIRYAIVEPFPLLRARQATQLAPFGAQVRWWDSLGELPPFRGVHFSNELLDALPVHLVHWNGSAWSERHVIEQDGTFGFVNRPLSDERLAQRLRSVAGPLPPGYETEVCLGVGDWVGGVASKLKAGLVIAVDYGFPRDEFYAPQRTTGTLRGYAQHRPVASPFEQVGQADLTAQVEWTSVVEEAENAGWQLAGFTDQHHFITGLLATEEGAKLVASAEAQTSRALQTLLHPAHLGMKFQFLVLQHNLPATLDLAGLRFARDPRAALGLPPLPR